MKKKKEKNTNNIHVRRRRLIITITIIRIMIITHIIILNLRSNQTIQRKVGNKKKVTQRLFVIN